MKSQHTEQAEQALDIATLPRFTNQYIGRGRAHQEPANDAPSVVQIRSTEFVTIDLFASISGLTASAVRNMIHEGKWVEGRQYQRRGGRVYVSIKGFEKWVATGLV